MTMKITNNKCINKKSKKNEKAAAEPDVRSARYLRQISAGLIGS